MTGSSPLDLDGHEMPIEAWKQMERRPGFKYEYVSGRARISVQKGAAPFVLTRLEDVIGATADLDRPPCTIIRPATDVEVPRLIEAWIEGFRGSPDYHGYDEETLRKSAAEQVYDLVDSDETETGPAPHAVSYVALGRRQKAAEKHVLGALFVSRATTRPWIEAVFVRPDMRRQGIASYLLREAAARLLASGETLIVSSYLLANQISARWHQMLGFVEIPDWLTCRHRYAILCHNWKTGNVVDAFAARRQLRGLADTARSLQSKQIDASGRGTPHDWLEEYGERFDAFADKHLPQRPLPSLRQLTMYRT